MQRRLEMNPGRQPACWLLVHGNYVCVVAFLFDANTHMPAASLARVELMRHVGGLDVVEDILPLPCASGGSIVAYKSSSEPAVLQQL